MANDSNENKNGCVTGFWLTYTRFFMKDELTKLHLLYNLLEQSIMISDKINTFLYRANFAFLEYIFKFIVWWVIFEIIGFKKQFLCVQCVGK